MHPILPKAYPAHFIGGRHCYGTTLGGGGGGGRQLYTGDFVPIGGGDTVYGQTTLGVWGQLCMKELCQKGGRGGGFVLITL